MDVLGGYATSLGMAAEVGAVQLFHGGVEGVEIGVDDVAGMR
jgi:hypothetical protein